MQLLSLLATSLYAIIGGPSSGKTTIIDELKLQGKQVIEEAATNIIKENIKKGNLHPWGQLGFQTEIFNLQLHLEKQAIANNMGDVFVDRGILDSIVYLKLRNQKNTLEYKNLHQWIKNLNISNRYAAVFFIEPHSFDLFECKQIETRCETTEESLKNSKAILEEYSKYYEVIIIPGNLSVKERANIILKKVNELKHKV